MLNMLSKVTGLFKTKKRLAGGLAALLTIAGAFVAGDQGASDSIIEAVKAIMVVFGI